MHAVTLTLSLSVSLGHCMWPACESRGPKNGRRTGWGGLRCAVKRRCKATLHDTSCHVMTVRTCRAGGGFCFPPPNDGRGKTFHHSTGRLTRVGNGPFFGFPKVARQREAHTYGMSRQKNRRANSLCQNCRGSLAPTYHIGCPFPERDGKKKERIQ